jgi:putative transposase
LACIQPSNPQQYAYIGHFNRAVRYEWLVRDDFKSLAEVQKTATQWFWNFNNERPDMGLEGITPKQKR